MPNLQEILTNYPILILPVTLGGFYFLSRTADWFVENATKLAEAMRLPEFMIGGVIGAIGTSLPELATSLAACFKGEGAFVIGTNLGSTITNNTLIIGVPLIILGIPAMLRREQPPQFQLDTNSYRPQETHFSIFGAILVVTLITMLDARVTRFEGLLLCLCYGGMLIDSLLHPTSAAHHTEAELAAFARQKTAAMGAVIGGLVIIGVLSTVIVDGLLAGATVLDLPKSIVGAIMNSVGTSFPEIVVGIGFAKRGQWTQVLTLAIGSNVFNMSLIVGLSALTLPLTIDPQMLLLLGVFVFCATGMLFMSFWDHVVSLSEAFMLIVIYLAFVLYASGAIPFAAPEMFPSGGAG